MHNKNVVLMAATNIKYREVNKVSEVKLKNTAEGIYQQINVHLSRLGTYFLTTETQKSLRGLIDEFSESIPQRLQHQVVLNGYFDQVILGMDMCDEALMDLDEGVEVVKEMYPEFYAAYQKSREIPNFGKVTMQMCCKVKDEEGNPIAGVEVQVCSKDNPEQALLSRKTALGGGINIKTLAEDYYVVKATKTGYEDVEKAVAVVFEKLCRVELVMKEVLLDNK